MWVPEKDREVLAILGKLAEECSELAGRCARAAIQGFHAIDTDDGRTNAEHIYDEIADVEAMIRHAKDRLITLQEFLAIAERAERKYAFKLPWFDFLKR